MQQFLSFLFFFKAWFSDFRACTSQLLLRGRRLSADPRPPGNVCTTSAGAASPRCLGKGREPPLRAAGLSVGRGSRTFPPSPGRHLPARSFPRGLQPGLCPLLVQEGASSPRRSRAGRIAEVRARAHPRRRGRGRGQPGGSCAAARPSRGSRSARRLSPRLRASLGVEGGARKRRARRGAQLRAWGDSSRGAGA